MKMKAIYVLFLIMSLALLAGCGSGGGSGSVSTSTGTVSMDIADAKPFIAGAQPDELWVVFDDVQVHTSGGGWVSLTLPETPFEINLLAFSDGLKTELATPTQIPAGHVTQIRFEIRRAYMVIYKDSPESDEVVEIDLDVPSGTLRTDKQIDWALGDGGEMSLTVHFDLSRSIVQAGQEYKLKPVLHLFNNNPEEAATICGNIAPASFVSDPPEVVVSVIWSGSEADEPYTVVTVNRESETVPTEFCIYWLVPLDTDETYTVRIDNGVHAPYEKVVAYPELGSGKSFELNGEAAISIP